MGIFTFEIVFPSPRTRDSQQYLHIFTYCRRPQTAGPQGCGRALQVAGTRKRAGSPVDQAKSISVRDAPNGAPGNAGADCSYAPLHCNLDRFAVKALTRCARPHTCGVRVLQVPGWYTLYII